jgi:ABC-type transport system substrate-binding protein
MSLVNDPESERLMSRMSVPMSRRQLFRRVAAVGLATPVVAGLLASCGEDDEEPEAAAGHDDDAPEEDPEADDDQQEIEVDEPSIDERRGGILRIALNSPAENFHPHHNHSFESTWPNSQMYSRLTRVSHDMEVEPDLALTWEPSEDGLTWTFEIREGVKFHNGNPCTAVHATQSFERLLDPEEGVPIRSQYEMIERLEAPSDTELIMHLSSVYADLPAILAGARALVFDVFGTVVDWRSTIIWEGEEHLLKFFVSTGVYGSALTHNGRGNDLKKPLRWGAQA